MNNKIQKVKDHLNYAKSEFVSAYLKISSVFFRICYVLAAYLLVSFTFKSIGIPQDWSLFSLPVFGYFFFIHKFSKNKKNKNKNESENTTVDSSTEAN